MSSFTRWFSMVIGVLVLGTALFLVSWEIPAPTERVERTISDERFPR